FFNEKTDLFDKLATIAEISLARKSSSGPVQLPTSFGDFLLKQVRVFPEPNTHHQWMLDLSRGNLSISDLIQKYGGIAQEEWKATPTSNCAILDSVAKYRCGFTEATWYIQVNVVSEELKAVKKDCDRRFGDSFYHPKRYQRRASEWTERLVQVLVSCARQCWQEPPPATTPALPKPSTPPLVPGKAVKGRKGISTKPTAAITPPAAIPTISILEKTIYLLKLSEYQYQLHLLDRHRYFLNLLSLYQKSLEQRPGSSTPQIPLPVGIIVQLLKTFHALLPDILEFPYFTKLLVKCIFQHLQLLIPDSNDIDSSVNSMYVESLACTMCSILRDLLLLGTDQVVQLKEDFLNLWPSYVLTDRFFDMTMCTKEDVALCLQQCRSKMDEVWARIARLKEFQCIIARKRNKEPVIDKKQRHDIEIFQILDEFHGGKTKLEVDEVYTQIFQDDRWTIDVHAVETVCEWAVSIYRPQEFKFLSVAHLLEMHNRELCRRNAQNNPRHHILYLQEILTNFLKRYVPLHCDELASLLDLYSLLIRRRLFCTQTFVQDMAIFLDEASPPTQLSPSFQFEYGPYKGGFNAKDIDKLGTTDRLLLYLWQFPRGPSPFGSLPMKLFDEDESTAITWMSILKVQPEAMKRLRSLERVMGLCTTIFSNASEELDVMGRVVELHHYIKRLSANDRCCLAQWLLNQLYDIKSTFFAGNDIDFTLRLILLLLELVDVLAMLQVLIHFVRHAPVYIVKTVIIPILDRHQMTFYASQDILALIQAYEFRCSQFRSMGVDPDDRFQTIAMFIARIYQNNSKELDKALKALNLRSPPEVLTKAFFAILKEDKLKTDLSKEQTLEGQNLKCAFPKDKDSMGADMVSVLGQIFLGLSDESTAPKAPEFQQIMGVTDAKNEMACRDPAVDNGVTLLLKYNPSTSQQRIFIFRAILTEVMDKWMTLLQQVLTKKVGTPANNGMRQVHVIFPRHIHRCVRFLRDYIDVQEESDRKLIRDTLLAWLNKEVIVGFNGTEPKDTKPRSKHPFLTRGDSSGKEAFALNAKGRLDKSQYGLKLFLMALIFHGIVDLPQVLRYVLTPGFPKKNNNPNTKPDPSRSLSNQLLSMALTLHLVDESHPSNYITLDAKTVAVIDDPTIKYHWRYLRSMLPSFLLFHILFVLCQISYQLSTADNSLKARDERGTLASLILFHCTNDMIVREALFSNKELRERNILKESDSANIWMLNVMLNLLNRPLNTPAELAPNRILLHKAEAIFNTMDKWLVHRGGSLYLETQMIRQNQKMLKRAKKPQVSVKCQSEVPASTSVFNYEPLVKRSLEPFNEKMMDKLELSASDKIAILVARRLFQKSARPQFVAPDVLTQPSSSIEMRLAQREAADVSIAHMYASIVMCVPSVQISSSLVGAVLSRVLENLEVDAKETDVAEFVNTFNGSIVATFLRRVLTWNMTPSGTYIRYMRSLVTQLEYLFEAAKDESKGMMWDASLRRKIALRLQLVCITASVNNYGAPYRNGIVKLLISFLETPLVSNGPGLTLFSWILDVIPLIHSTVFTENDSTDLVLKLKLPPELKCRLFAVLPKNMSGARQISIKRKSLDPWALVEGFTDLPSDCLVQCVATTSQSKAKRRRIWRAI
ncbi:hypothetical protein THRCLA_05620, partial [Thraustotheca clavata]